MKRKMFALILGALGIFSMNMHAATEIISAKRLDKKVRQYRHSVVLFHAGQKASKSIFEDVSRKSTYRTAGFKFFYANVKESADFAAYMKQIGVSKTPAIVIFEDGNVRADSRGKRAVLEGFDSLSEVRLFIEKHLGGVISRIESDEEEEEDDDRSTSSSPRVGISFGVGYPYDYYYPGYYRPWGYRSWGHRHHWRGHWGGRRHHRRR